MSKIIRQSAEGEPVTIGKKPVVTEYTPVRFEPPEPASRVTLDFNRRISETIDHWTAQVKSHVAAAEDERQRKTDDDLRSATEQAREDGKNQERAEREDYIDSHFASRMAIIEQLLIKAKKHQHDSFEHLERKVIDLAVSIAETLINRSIEADPGILDDIVRESMSYIINSEKLIVRVSADDFQMISEKHDQWYSLAGNVKEFRIEPDKRLNRGDCLIETEGGIIDATIKSRLDTVAGELIRVPKQ